MPRDLYLAADIGGTKILAIAATRQGKILARHYVATAADMGERAVIQRLIQALRQVGDFSPDTPPSAVGIGVGAAGLIETEAGLVISSPNLPGWHNVPLKEIVEKELRLDTYLLNDANAAALGEHRFGAGRGVKDLIFITVSTGIGGGIILGGKLYAGATGTAGEVGHMTISVDGPPCHCGNRGCLEAMASGWAVAGEAQRAVERGAKTILSEMSGEITAEMVFQAAERGDALAGEIIHSAACNLGVGLANLVNLLNPQLIIIGGGLSQMGERLFAPAQKVMHERAFSPPAQAVRVVSAALGADAGVLGAVAYVAEQKARLSRKGGGG